MKLLNFVVVVTAALAVGGLAGFTFGNRNGTPTVALNPAAVAQPPAAESSSAVESRVGAVGVLQAIGGDSLSLQTREGLLFVSVGAASGIDQLKPGDKVAVWAQKVDGQIVARQIVVVPQSPQRVHYLGLVADVAPDRIDVIGQQGETTAFRVDTAVQWMPDASRAPQIGDTVTVVAKPDPLGDGWLAVAVVTR